MYLVTYKQTSFFLHCPLHSGAGSVSTLIWRRGGRKSGGVEESSLDGKEGIFCKEQAFVNERSIVHAVSRLSHGSEKFDMSYKRLDIPSSSIYCVLSFPDWFASCLL